MSVAHRNLYSRFVPLEIKQGQVEPAAGPIKVGWPLGHFHSPVVDTRRAGEPAFRSRVWPPEPRPTPGIEWRAEAQLELCRAFAEQGPLEFASRETAGPQDYFVDNGVFSRLDAWVLQGILRHAQPDRVTEVGAGYSSLVTARVNRELLAGQAHVTCIDPHPREFLVDGVPGIAELRVEEVQSTPAALFDELSEGDVLFIDSSHVVKTGSDVPWLFHEILPRLAPGVLVHVHDVYLPGDYPPEWVLDGWGWNETYLVQSFLAFNFAFEVVFGVQWMIQHHWEALRQAFPLGEQPRSAGSSLWIRRR